MDQDRRLVNDQRIDEIVLQIGEIKGQHAVIVEKLDENTKMTKEAVEVLKAFKLLGFVIKWVTLIGGAVVGGYHAIDAAFAHLSRFRS